MSAMACTVLTVRLPSLVSNRKQSGIGLFLFGESDLRAFQSVRFDRISNRQAAANRRQMVDNRNLIAQKSIWTDRCERKAKFNAYIRDVISSTWISRPIEREWCPSLRWWVADLELSPLFLVSCKISCKISWLIVSESINSQTVVRDSTSGDASVFVKTF